MKRTINWMEVKITVEYDPEADYDTEAFSHTDLEKGEFSLHFKEICCNHIAHECYHLFFRVMLWMDNVQNFDFFNLGSEIYAWNFGFLVDKVNDALGEMRKEYDKKGKD